MGSRFTMGNKQFFFFLFVMMGISFLIINFIGPEKSRVRIIDGDGSGYYAYLPAIFVHKTVDFTPVFELEKERRSSDYMGHYFHQLNDIIINKYTTGTALMELPLFLIAYLLSLLLGLEPDGYNLLFQYSVAMSAFLWVFTGFFFLQKLASLYQIKKPTTQLLLVFLLLGTNLFFYTFIAPSASHAYSFALISILLYLIKSVFLNYSRGKVFLAALVLGLVVLVRPVNILVVFAIPFLAGSAQVFAGSIKQKLKNKDYIFTIAIFLIAISPQIIINILQTSMPFVFGYKNEGFFFGNPEMVQFLISFRKGWFVYTPFMLFIIPATFYLLKRSKFEFFSFLSFIVLIIYVFSSWWNWIFGDSFGMRPMIDFYGLFIIIIAIFFDSFRRKIYKYVFYALGISFVFLNIFQTYQAAANILHPDSMGYNSYKHIFLKAGDEYEGVVADASEYYYGSLTKDPFFVTKNKIDENEAGWSDVNRVFHVPNNNYPCVELNAEMVYSPTYTYSIPGSWEGVQNIYIKFRTSFFEPDIDAGINSMYVVDIKDDAGNSVFYKAFRMKKLPDETTNTWRDSEIGFKLPTINNDMSTIKFYVWNKSKDKYYIRSLELLFYTYSR